MNLFNDLQRLKSEVEALKVRLNSIMVGQTIITTQFTGLLPIGNGGTGSPYGPLYAVPVFVNNSGGNLVDGDVVVLDFSGARRVDLDTTAANLDAIGVVKGAGPYANGASTPVMTLGYHTGVKVQGTVDPGDYLAVSTTTNRAATLGPAPAAGAFARAFTANVSGAGTVEAWIFPVIAGAGGGGPVISDQTANTDGVEDTFTLPSTPAAGTVRVWLNGLMQRESVDFTVVGDTVVMTDPPASDDELVVVYGEEGSTPFLFTQLLDVPASYTGSEGFAVFVNGAGTGLEFVELPDSSEAKFPNLRPASPNAMDDEYDDSSGSSGSVNGIDAKWTARGTTPSSITYPAPSWALFEANSATFGYDQAKPAAQDYTVNMRCGMGGDIASGNSFGGLYVVDAVNWDMFTLHVLVGNNNTRVMDIEVASWGTAGSWFGGAFTLQKGINGQPVPTNLQIRYVHSTTTFNFEVSYDGGLTWVLIHSLTDTIGHTRVGWFKTGSGSGSLRKDQMSVDYFRRTA